MDEPISELETYRTVTACREAMREAMAKMYEANQAALMISGGDQELVRMAIDAELACHRARLEMVAPIPGGVGDA